MAADDAAVVVTLQANLKDYETALKNAVRMTERAAKSAEDAVSGIGKSKPPKFEAVNQNFQKSAKQLANDARVMQFQLNDIFSGLATGQGVRAVQVQLGQIAQIMQGGGIKQGAEIMGTALMGMINPIDIAIVAFGTLLPLAASFFTGSEQGSEAAAKAAKAQADALDVIIQKYGDLVPALQHVADAANHAAEAAANHAAAAAGVAATYAEIKAKVAALNLPDIFSKLQLAGAPSDEQNKFLADMDNLNKKIEAGTATAKDAQAVIDDLSAATEKYGLNTKEAASALTILKPDLDAAAHAAQGVAQNASAATDALKNYSEFIKKLNSIVGTQKSVFDQLKEALDKYIASLSNLDEKQRAVFENRAIAAYGQAVHDALNQALEGDQGDIDSFVERVIKRESGGDPNAKNKDSTATGAGQFLGSTWLDVMRKHFADQIEGMNKDEILALRNDLEWSRRAIRAYAEDNAKILEEAGFKATEANLQLSHFLGPQGAVAVLKAEPGTRFSDIHYKGQEAAIAANQTILGHGATREDVLAYVGRKDETKETKKASTALDDWNKKQADAIELAKKRNAIDSDTTKTINEKNAAIEEEKLYQEGVNAAVEQYGTVSEEQKKQIRETAHEAALLGLTLSNYKEQQKSNQAELKALSKEVTSIGESAVQGLVNDLMNGVSAGQAFNNMLKNIISSLAQMAVKSLFSQQGLGGIIGGIFGVNAPGAAAGGLVSLAGHNEKRNPLLWAGAPRFQSGGMVGLRPGEVPIIAHKGEFVLPAARTMGGYPTSGRQAVPNQYTYLGDVNIDMSQTGLVSANNDDAKTFGRNMQKLIQIELVKESRPGGLLRKAPGI